MPHLYSMRILCSPSYNLCLLRCLLLALQQGKGDGGSSAPAPAKKMTVWKKLKKALFKPGKSKREVAAEQLMRGSNETATSQRYSEKHANQADGVVNYSRKTSFQEARENLAPPQAYRSASAAELLYCCSQLLVWHISLKQFT